MLGSQHIEIDAKDFLKGFSSHSEIADGGLSPDSEAINPIVVPGVIYAPAAGVDSDTDTRLTDEIIASSPDMVSFAGTNRLLVTEAGKACRYNGTKVSAAEVALTAGYTYTKGFTDIIVYKGEAYVTAKNGITRWDNADLIDDGANFPFAFTNTNRPHPALVFEDNAFFGDRNLLVRLTSAGGLPATILTLSNDQEITALGIDRGTGKMLIATVNSLNISGTIPQIAKLHWYDGFSNKPLKTVVVDAPIYGLWELSSTTYVGYGQNLGYLSGSGIEFLRKLLNVTLDSEDLPYKHNFANIANRLFVVDGAKILCFGEIVRGQKTFWYAYKNQLSSVKFKCIFDAGNNKLGFSFATSKFYTVDISANANLDKLDVYTNWLKFPRPVLLRSLYLACKGSIASTANFSVAFVNRESDSTALVPGVGTMTSIFVVPDIIGFKPNKNTEVRIRIQNSTENDGIIRMILYYDWAE